MSYGSVLPMFETLLMSTVLLLLQLKTTSYIKDLFNVSSIGNRNTGCVAHNDEKTKNCR